MDSNAGGRATRPSGGAASHGRQAGGQGVGRGARPVKDSVRRDLRELAAAGLCQRVYGGALPVSPAIADLATRSHLEPASKQRIAARAAELVVPGASVILDGGTTTAAVVAALPSGPGVHGDHDTVRPLLPRCWITARSRCCCWAAGSSSIRR